jgi:glyoxylase-like metal-dependent hydrolase (beta-lactamase superfamily II)
MKKIFDDMWQTSLEQPFAGLNSHAYFLSRDNGNVLFYNTGNTEEIREISKMGGISFQYLSHRHESGNSLNTKKSLFNSQLCADEVEAPHIASTIDVVFKERQIHSSNIEIIPTSGHTKGGICFFYNSLSGHKYLFTGDLLHRSFGTWDTLVFSSHGGSAVNLIDSLSILRKLEPTVVICSAFVGKTAFLEISQHEWYYAIDTNISKLSKRV